ncbi:MAG: FxsA family protein, partial [Myxococcales bacterium]
EPGDVKFPGMGRLFLLFTLVPLLELYLLVKLGERIGAGTTVIIVLLTGLVGAWLAKREGLRALHSWRRAIAEGRLPDEGIVSGLLVLVGGVLLVTPGVLTDVAGLSLLFPPTRRWIGAQVRRGAARRIREGALHVRVGGFGRRPPRHARDQIVDVEQDPRH